MKSKLALAITAFMLFYIVFNLSNWKDRYMFRCDETGYYLYLPSFFIYHDIGYLKFYPKIVEKYYINDNREYGLYKEPTGYRLDKYAIGTSILEMPFFLAAHLYCSLYPKDYPPDGYSEPYMLTFVLATVFWVIAGLFVLRKFLLRYFTDAAVTVTILLLAFATNIYFYTVFDTGMSHTFSFALFCFLLAATDRWYDNERIINVLLMGFLLGLIVITRPTNIVVAIIPLCWKYKNGSIAGKTAFYKKQLLPVLASFFIFCLVLFIQCRYWKFVTGHWIHFSYEDEGFNFLSSQVWNGLFSYRKGWFVYTPVAFLGVIGLIPLARKYKRLAGIILLYLIVNVYIVFSWYFWSYGGSFGCRALIESMAVVSVPLAMLIQWLLVRKKALITIPMLLVFAFLIALNTFQSFQLIKNITVWDGTNRAFYWRSFGKLNVTSEDKKLLP